MGFGFALSFAYIALAVVQGGLVAVPVETRIRGRATALGLVVPVGMLAIGVALLNTVADAPRALAILGWTATPALAAAAGWLLRPLRLSVTVPLAAALYLAAWRLSGNFGEFAALVLICMACLALAAIVQSVTSDLMIRIGLVVLCVVDAILVWGSPQVGPASDALANTPAPVLAAPGLASRALPSLQQVTLGSMQMGWIDMLAPALLALTIPLGRRLWPAVATVVAAYLWGLLLLVSPGIPATTPVLAGLAVAILQSRRAPRARPVVGQIAPAPPG